jgi:prepilin-type processing-associated H-X9-DG protein
MYAAVHHDLEAPIDVKNNGVFFLNSRVRYDDIGDGSAHTLFLGEKLPDIFDLPWMSGTRGTLRNTGAMINSLTYSTGLTRPRTDSWQPAQPSDGLGMGMSSDPSAVDGLLEAPAEIPAPDEPDGAIPDPTGAAGAPAVVGPGPGTPLFVGGFASQHANGCMFAFGDGSVRYISNSIALPTLQQLAHRNDGKLPAEY